MKYEIKINQIFTSQLEEGLAKVVAFIIEGSEDQFTATCYGEINVAPTDTCDCVCKECTTEEEVVEWVKHSLGDKLSDYERIVQERIDAQKNPIVATALPWVKEEEIQFEKPVFTMPSKSIFTRPPINDTK
jgi:hypothetical protein